MSVSSGKCMNYIIIMPVLVHDVVKVVRYQNIVKLYTTNKILGVPLWTHTECTCTLLKYGFM